ncbi:DUF3093 domain-containing protein [Saxibacter everestensis]|uniref:DUF3093 domain-containing protein n=1 Tax=Saxibacter everestensis TaxID=2909229 RepID=A0ABY8QWK9_9MICO|nr:DUF3093 domain-containing protein [Brevibacteriaceae bacterium ZFBP1038]
MSQPSPDSPAIIYSERLWPAWWVWTSALLVSGATVLVLIPLSTPAAIVTPIVVFGLFCWWLVSISLKIEVTADTLQVGKARVERKFLGPAKPHLGPDATNARGPGLDVRAFLSIRGWVRDVVEVELIDHEDPAPYWLFSTREPQKLSTILNG